MQWKSAEMARHDRSHVLSLSSQFALISTFSIMNPGYISSSLFAAVVNPPRSDLLELMEDVDDDDI